jgi:hypothetical protein
LAFVDRLVKASAVEGIDIVKSKILKLYQVGWGERFVRVDDPTTTYRLDRGDGMFMWVTRVEEDGHKYNGPQFSLHIGEDVVLVNE